MGPLHRSLEQNQARSRLGRIHAAPKLIVRQRQVIKIRILPAQRELKPALAVGVPMAGAETAPGLRKLGHHIAREAYLSRMDRTVSNARQGEQSDKQKGSLSRHGGHARRGERAETGGGVRGKQDVQFIVARCPIATEPTYASRTIFSAA